MQKELFESIDKSYEFLLPGNRETILLLINLQEKIDSGQVEEKCLNDTGPSTLWVSAA